MLESETGGTTSLHIFRDEIVPSVIWYIVHLCSHNKILSLGNLKGKVTYFFIVLEAGKYFVKVPAGLLSAEDCSLLTRPCLVAGSSEGLEHCHHMMEEQKGKKNLSQFLPAL